MFTVFKMENHQADYARQRLEKLGKTQEVKIWLENYREGFSFLSKGDCVGSLDMASESGLHQTTAVYVPYITDIESLPEQEFRSFIRSQLGIDINGEFSSEIYSLDDNLSVRVTMPNFDRANIRLGLVRYLNNIDDIVTGRKIVCSSTCLFFHSLTDFDNIFGRGMGDRLQIVDSSVGPIKREYVIK